MAVPYGRIALRDRLEMAAVVRWMPGSVDRTTVFERFAAAGYRRPLLAVLLSLSDGGRCAPPLPGPIDALTRPQKGRIALQARSPVTTPLPKARPSP